MENEQIINNNDLKENIIEAEYDECNESVYLIDNPWSEEEDSIGFGVYINNLIDILTNMSAKIIGLISNYGSGKSTVVDMVSSNINKKAKLAKNISEGGILVLSIGTTIIGLFII